MTSRGPRRRSDRCAQWQTDVVGVVVVVATTVVEVVVGLVDVVEGIVVVEVVVSTVDVVVDDEHVVVVVVTTDVGRGAAPVVAVRVDGRVVDTARHGGGAVAVVMLLGATGGLVVVVSDRVVVGADVVAGNATSGDSGCPGPTVDWEVAAKTRSDRPDPCACAHTRSASRRAANPSSDEKRFFVNSRATWCIT